MTKYIRKTIPSMNDRAVVRRFDRLFKKLVRQNAKLQLLYNDECFLKRSAELEEALHAFFLHGMLHGGHHALKLAKHLGGRI